MSRALLEVGTEPSLFAQQMQDVKPLAADARVRLQGQSLDEAARQARQQAAQQAATELSHPFGFEAVPLLDPHEVVSFKRPGVQEGVFRKLRLGQYPVETSLDLQGMGLETARHRLLEVLGQCQQWEIRSLLIRHGRGRQSQPPAQLKSHVCHWLGLWPQVLAYHSAPAPLGGSAVTLVLLRKGQQDKQHTRERIQKRLPE